VTPPGSVDDDRHDRPASRPGARRSRSPAPQPERHARNDTATLTVFTAGAAAPVLSAPADAAVNVPVRPSFSWAASAGAAEYLLEVDDAADFATPIYSATVAGTSHTPASDLPSNSELRWRVTADNPCAAATSPVRSFTTVPLPGDCATGSVANPVYEYGFESGAGGWESSGTGNTWAQTTARVHSGSFSWRAQDPITSSDQALVSPPITLPAGQLPLTLQFWNHQTFEPRSGGCWDGALVEISTGAGGPFTPITTGLLTDPYDGPLGSGNPAAGLSAWCGDPQDWLESVIDLAPWAGQTVYLRFRATSDGSQGRAPDGWYLDDITVQGCVTATLLFEGDFETGNTSAWSATVP
jgi:hypothetical protein